MSIVKKIGNITLYHGDSAEVLKSLESNSVGTILIDPPYIYEKSMYTKDKHGNKIKAFFDETYNKKIIFRELYRVLDDNSFIGFFGRGIDFYKNNLVMENIGFEFKEELVWRKQNASNFMNTLPRVHELCNVFSKGNVVINKCRVDYFNYLLGLDDFVPRMHFIFKRLKSAIKGKELDYIKKYVETGEKIFRGHKKKGFGIVGQGGRNLGGVMCFFSMFNLGTVEKSVISENNIHWKRLHPTQKPVELLKRILNLTVKDKNKVVLDCFAGSGSTGVACIELGLSCILIEKNKEYFDIACKRIQEVYNSKKNVLF